MVVVVWGNVLHHKRERELSGLEMSGGNMSESGMSGSRVNTRSQNKFSAGYSALRQQKGKGLRHRGYCPRGLTS